MVWALPISYKMNKIFETDIKAYELMPKKLVKKYPWIHRKDVDKLSKCNLIIGGIFLLPLRLLMGILGQLI